MKIPQRKYRVTLLGVALSGALTAAAPAQSVIVEQGQTLSGIAQQHLGSAARWTEICAANRAVLDGNCHLIRPGLELTLPDEPDIDAVVTLEALPPDNTAVTELGEPTAEAETVEEPADDRAAQPISTETLPDATPETEPEPAPEADVMAEEIDEPESVGDLALTELPPNNATVTKSDEMIAGLAVKKVVTDAGEGHHRVRYSLGAVGPDLYGVRVLLRFDDAEAVNILVFDDDNRAYARVHLGATDDGVEIAGRSGVESAELTSIGDDWHELTFSFMGRASDRETQMLIYPTADMLVDSPSRTLSMTDPVITLED